MGSARRFIRELKRRKVFRSGVAYAIAAWLLIQVVETTFPYLGLPERAVTLVIVLAVAGLPVALVLAWLFDLTPGGVDATAPAGPDPEPSVPAAPAPDTVPVPVAPTALVGREAELSEGERLLGEEGHRLLTLVGPGGAGKTRLAMELAHRLAPRFRDGVAWVPLDTVRDPILVPSSLGRAIGIGETGAEELTTRIASALRDRELLLVADNFEQVIGAAHHVGTLLAACPGLSMLVTSRAPLRVRGERELPVPPLETPDGSRSAAELMASPAVRLFAERARDVNPGFEITEANVADVAALCRRLDGLPLALELAAARSKVLAPDAMLARLEQRTPLLARGSRDGPAHHRTLRDTIDWSHELLGPEERVLFRRLSVFAGESDLDAVQAVAGPDLESDVLDLVEALVDQSLTVAVSDEGGGARFRMLEMIREYAADALAASGEEEAVRSRHAEHFAGLARSAEPELVGPRQAEWLELLERDHDDLRDALDWLTPRDPEVALGLAVSLWRFWEIRGHLTEGRRRLDGLIEATDPAEGPGADRKIRLKALYAAGVLADSQGDYAAARERFEATLAAYRDAGDRWGVANALNNIGVVALRNGDYDTAHRLYTSSASIWRELGNDAAVALALNNVGNVERLRGDHAAARAALEESLAMQRAAGDANGCALTLGLLAEVARDQGATEEAEGLYDESLELFRGTGNRPQIARSLLELGRLHREQGRPEPARARAAEALLEYVAVGSPRGLADALDELAGVTGEERLAAAARALRAGGDVDVGELVRRARGWAVSLTDAAPPT